MPWDTVFENASPYAIVLVLIWLIWELLKFLERLISRLDNFSQTIDKCITALQVSAEAKRSLCARIDILEDKVQETHAAIERLLMLRGDDK